MAVIIDMHAHLGDLRSPDSLDRIPISIECLIARLDEEGIDKAVVLPWPACPEAVRFPGLFSSFPDIVSQIRAAASHGDRLIPFGNADPRWGGNSPKTDFTWLLERFAEIGCAGIGEVSANMRFDDPRAVNLFRQCGKWGFPVTIESAGPGTGHYGFIDLPGSPRLERLLALAPDTAIIGHGPGFWADIAAVPTRKEKSSYPSGPVTAEGSVSRLLRAFPNLHADLSAKSGYNAITRDPAFGFRFLSEFQDRLLFGTDACFADKGGGPVARPRDWIPHLAHLRGLRKDGRISQEVFDKITFGNALRILRRPAGSVG